jgi:hypothetical protein
MRLSALHGKRHFVEGYWMAMSQENVEAFKRGIEAYNREPIRIQTYLDPKEAVEAARSGY